MQCFESAKSISHLIMSGAWGGAVRQTGMVPGPALTVSRTGLDWAFSSQPAAEHLNTRGHSSLRTTEPRRVIVPLANEITLIRKRGQ